MPRGTKRKIDNDPSKLVESSKRRRSLRIAAPIRKLETLPMNIFIKIIRYIPLAQWPSMERVSPRIRDSMFEAWKTVEKIRIFDDLLATTKYYNNDVFMNPEVPKSVLKKLRNRAINLTEIIDLPKIAWKGQKEFNCFGTNLTTFKNLRRLEIGRGVGLDIGDLATFLVDTSARDRLTDLSLICSSGDKDSPHQHLDRLANAFENLDDRKPLRLEVLNMENNRDRLECDVDTSRSFDFLRSIDVSRLTTFLVSGTLVPRRKLTDFIDRATNLERLSFSFTCVYEGPRPRPQDHVLTVRDENIGLLKSIEKLERLESLTIGAVRAQKTCQCREIPEAMTSLFRTLAGRHHEDGRQVFNELQFLYEASVPSLVAPIADHLRNLESLTLVVHYLNGATLKRVLRSQTQLKRLRLCHDERNWDNDGEPIDRDEELDRRVYIEDILPNASTLETLSVQFTLAGLLLGDFKLLAQFHRLENLKIILDEDRQFRYERAVHRSIFAIKDKIDDSVLSLWADGFGRNLKSFKLGLGDLDFFEKGLLELLSKASGLRVLTLKGEWIEDEFLQQLPALCPLISELNILESDSITKSTMQTVLGELAHLKVVRCWCYGKWSPKQLKMPKYRRIRFDVWGAPTIGY